MAGLMAVRESEHGAGLLLGLAPSAAAAEVLAAELGAGVENTAKWLYEHCQHPQRAAELAGLERALQDPADPRCGQPATLARVRELGEQLERWPLRAGQLVVVDEASLAGTFALDELATAAETAGAKVLLVGDPNQLSAVEAGGMFAALVRDRDGGAPDLSDVRRFRHAWEKDASLLLRDGQEEAIDAYERHGRVIGGRREELLTEVYAAWKDDVDRGLSSLMIAADSKTGAAADHREGVGEERRSLVRNRRAPGRQPQRPPRWRRWRAASSRVRG